MSPKYLLVIFTLMSANTWAAQDEGFLEEFKANPINAMMQTPKKSKITPYRFEVSTQSLREKLIEQNFQSPTGIRPMFEIQPNDLVSNLVDTIEIINDLYTMEERGLRFSQLDESPWSGDYWPIASGVLASRPFDPEFTYLYEWKEKKDYVEDNKVETVLSQRADPSPYLSAAEKYDLLIGSEGRLTQRMWEDGQYYYDNNDGEVESWMGICHGWAPAAFMMPRPRYAVEFKTADGARDLKFYPSEIRGLASFMWAEGNYRSRFIGGRCNEKEPELDDEGRLTQPQCIDTNPGTWHQVVVNQIGVARRSFVMDATYDYEVWNQPVYAYQYNYFSTKTMRTVSSLDQAIVPIDQMTEDIFAPHRSEKARYLVGIQMQVAYFAEVGAFLSEEDLSEDNIVYVQYTYDLELDENKKIIGGEWYNHAHPDFLWVPIPGAKPRTFNDFGFNPEELSFERPLTDEIKLKAQQNSRYGYILPTLVEAIVHRSHRAELQQTSDD
ncbi:MAG: hypothetical protein R2827_06055 [Bdellovibrionales bacterium]